jgi:hypothetical protein
MQALKSTAPRNNALCSAAAVLYASLAILWLAIPQSVTNWSREYLPDFAQPIAAPITGTVEAIADATGISQLYQAARDRFQPASKN